MSKLHKTLEDFIENTNKMRKSLREAGVEDNGILNLFAQAYAIVGLETETGPDTLVRILAIHSVGLAYMIEDPDLSEDDLKEHLQQDLRLTPEELAAALCCQPEGEEIPLVLSTVTGEA